MRTVEESLAQAEKDYFFLVALLDARLIYGSTELYDELLARLPRRFVEGQREDFVEKMKGHRLSRRERFGSHSYLLEPHIKEGRGGMRDIQAMMWTARMVFGLHGLSGHRRCRIACRGRETGLSRCPGHAGQIADFYALFQQT